jgi:hypothetical protein
MSNDTIERPDTTWETDFMVRCNTGGQGRNPA